MTPSGTRVRAPRGRARLLVGGVALALTLAGCGGSAKTASGTVIGITERDFHIGTTTTHVNAGRVTLRIHNAGPDEHELIVAPERPGGLPLRADGFTVNEQAIESSEPGSVEPQQPDHTELLSVHLKPGRYVLFCNMEGHYMAGMHIVLVVR